jgi:hypothetical protein
MQLHKIVTSVIGYYGSQYLAVAIDSIGIILIIHRTKIHLNIKQTNIESGTSYTTNTG